MQTLTDAPPRAKFADAFAERSDAYLEFDADEVHALDPAELDALKLAHAQRLFAQQRARIEMVDKQAHRAGISAIKTFDDLVPLFLSHETYRTYPQAWLEASDFTRMTKWLSKLVSKDLTGIDVSGEGTIEEWFSILADQAGMSVVICGAEGKATFLPRTNAERRSFYRAMFWAFNSTIRSIAGEDAVLKPGVDRVPLVHPGARTGSRTSELFLDLYTELFGDGLVDAALTHSDADLISLAGRIRAASAKGEAASLQIGAELSAKKERIKSINAANAAGSAAQVERLLTEYQGRRIIFYGTMQGLYDLAQKLRACGEIAFTSDSFFFCGGGFAGGKTPDRWRETTAEALGTSPENIITSYGVIEGLFLMTSCRAGKFHVPVALVPFLLDEDSGEPLPRAGRQTGRFAFHDLTAQDSWGGFVTPDRLTIEWDGGCACGRKGAYVEPRIERVPDKDNDKIGCAGTTLALEEATDFIVRS